MTKEIIKDCTLYLGDTRDILPVLGFCADLIISDPPEDNNFHFQDIMDLHYNALRSGSCYVFSSAQRLLPMLDGAETQGLDFHDMLVLDRGNNNISFVGLFYKGTAKYFDNKMPKEAFSNLKETDHPEEKPVSVLERYILNSTQPGDTVLDPFFGSGSTAIACLNTGRKFIGIENDKKWFDLAVDRIESHNTNKERRIV